MFRVMCVFVCYLHKTPSIFGYYSVILLVSYPHDHIVLAIVSNDDIHKSGKNVKKQILNSKTFQHVPSVASWDFAPQKILIIFFSRWITVKRLKTDIRNKE